MFSGLKAHSHETFLLMSSSNVAEVGIRNFAWCPVVIKQGKVCVGDTKSDKFEFFPTAVLSTTNILH